MRYHRDDGNERGCKVLSKHGRKKCFVFEIGRESFNEKNRTRSHTKY